MRAELESLINLQAVDCKLRELERSTGDLPQVVEELTGREKSLSEKLNLEKSELNDWVLKKKNVQSDVVISKEKLEKYKKQLYEVKTNREYDAVTMEIDMMKEAIFQKEYNVLEIDEKIEALEQNMPDSEKKLKEIQNDLLVSQKTLNDQLAEISTQKLQLIKDREKLVQTISRKLLSLYDRIRSARNGEALTLVLNGACSACNSRIPPQRGLEVRLMNEVYTCEVCGRILVWQEDRTSLYE